MKKQILTLALIAMMTNSLTAGTHSVAEEKPLTVEEEANWQASMQVGLELAQEYRANQKATEPIEEETYSQGNGTEEGFERIYYDDEPVYEEKAPEELECQKASELYGANYKTCLKEFYDRRAHIEKLRNYRTCEQAMIAYGVPIKTCLAKLNSAK